MIHINRRSALGRRALLRGAFGAGLSLPFLEIMVGPRASRAAVNPKRFLVAFGGFSLGADGDPKHNDYVPDTVGPGYDATKRSAIAPLAKDGLSKEITVVSGLRVPREGAGRYDAGHYHGGNHSPLLSGVPNIGNDASSAAILGPTSDQIVADAIAGDTRFRSLSYCVQPKGYSGGPWLGWVISMRKREDRLERIEPTVSPQQAYRALFFNFQTSTDTAAQKQFELERKTRVSVLDACQASRARLEKRLGASDMKVITQYYDQCRDLEKRISAMPTAAQGSSCMALADPGADPQEGGDTFSSMQNNGMVPVGTGWSNETLRARLFADLIHMAFTCDLSRVASLVFTRNQCFMSTREIAGYGVDLHSLGHRIGGSPSTTMAVSKGIAWHMGHWGYLVGKLRDTKDGTGRSLLDDAAMAFVNEGGHGPNPEEAKQFGAQDLIDNGSSHSMENMACVIAGGAGGLKRGHHVAATGKHPVNVLISLMNAVGVPADKLGEVSGKIPDLFGV